MNLLLTQVGLNCYCLVFLDGPLPALFHGQWLFGRAMSVRLDRWNDVRPQMIPRILPAGLESIGIGLGIGGKPLQDIGQIASKYRGCFSHDGIFFSEVVFSYFINRCHCNLVITI